MTTPATAQGLGDSPVSARGAVPRAYRDPDGLLGGVCSGLAAHLGVEVWLVRIAFAVLAITGFSIALYAGLWIFLPMRTEPQVRAPGIEAATRRGSRKSPTRALRTVAPVLALAALALGGLGLFRAIFGAPSALIPIAVAAVGLILVWQQADDAQRTRWTDADENRELRRVVFGAGGRPALVRVGMGLGALMVALGIFAAQSGSFETARSVLLAAFLGMVGLTLMVGPWLVGLGADLTEERAARLRSQERADVAAHLHDSVLQTLALIQKNSADPAAVSRLARAQERDLRTWMFEASGTNTSNATTVASAVRAVAAEVEDEYGVRVEVVNVADSPMKLASGGGEDRGLTALVGAAREGITNAAKHAGSSRIDVYLEVAAASASASGGSAARAASVFIRDRGVGFVVTDIPTDRAGVRGSIVDRIERHGGVATIISSLGEGTEVRLVMPLPSGVTDNAKGHP